MTRRPHPVLRVLALAVPALLVLGGIALAGIVFSGWRFTFARPWWLLALPVALVGWALLRTALRSASSTELPGPRLHVSRGADLAALKPTWRTRFSALPGALRLVAIVLLGVALARPQRVDVPETLELSGIDIVLVLDMSGSMRAADLQPTRLEAAKATLAEFIDRRRTDRIGFVVFAREAFPVLAPTLDYAVLKRTVAAMSLDETLSRETQAGTAIGDGLGTAVNYLRRSDARSKVVVLLTDGANNAGHLDPHHAAQFAKTLNIRTFTILMGTSDEAPVEQGRDIFGRPVMGMMRFPVDPQLLQDIATETGAQFFRAGDQAALSQAFHQILDQLERSRIEDAGVRYTELFPYLLFPALALILLEVVLATTLLRRFP